MTDRPKAPQNVIMLDDHSGKIVDSILRPEIKVYRNKTVTMFLPDVADDPATLRDLAAVFQHLADVLLDKAASGLIGQQKE